MDNVTLDAYLFFEGNCRPAMEFYKGIFGGQLDVQTYDEVPAEMPGREQMKGKVIHARLAGGDVNLMASDTHDKTLGTGKIELSVSGDDEAKLRKIFDGLSAGGKVSSPLKKEFWGDTFGSLTDKFGIGWMVNITAKKE
ncbi:MAG TPA: VOC family protein [bacterium]|jgi:PhnB protein